MLLRSIQMHISLYQELQPELCRKLAAGLYMDNIAIGFASVEEAATQMEVTQNIFREASMMLHIAQGATDQRAFWGLQDPGNELEHRERHPCCHDTYLFFTQNKELLSVITKPFDPLGILSPWLIKGKVLFQKTWLSSESTTWDSDLRSPIRRGSFWNVIHALATNCRVMILTDLGQQALLGESNEIEHLLKGQCFGKLLWTMALDLLKLIYKLCLAFLDQA